MTRAARSGSAGGHGTGDRVAGYGIGWGTGRAPPGSIHATRPAPACRVKNPTQDTVTGNTLVLNHTTVRGNVPDDCSC
jgi:hypothetical protein